MKTFYIFIFALCILSFKSNAQTIFQKIFVPGNSDGISCVQTFDSGYASMGSGDSNGVNIVKTDMQGNLLWAKNYVIDGIIYRDVRNIIQSDDSGYVVTGTAAFDSTNDFFILHVDVNGNVLWCSVFDGGGDDYSYSVTETYDHGFAVSGSTDNLNLLILKVDSTGNLLWANKGNASEGYGIKETTDRGLIVVSTYDDTLSNDVCLIKMDSLGNFIWAKTYGGPDTDYGWAVDQVNDGGYIIGAETRSFPSGEDKFYILQTDSIGELKWGRTYHGSTGWDWPLWVSQTPDGGFVTAGMNDYTGDAGPMIIKTDSTGIPEWSMKYGTNLGEYMWNTGAKTSDHGFLLTASFSLSNASGMYFIKTDSAGNSGGCNETSINAVVDSPATVQHSVNLSFSGVGGLTSKNVTVTVISGDSALCSNALSVNEIKPEKLISVFPNPAENIIHIRFPKETQANIQLVDMQGKILVDTFTSSSDLALDISAYPGGIYLVHYYAGNNSECVRIEKIHSN